MDVSRNIPVFAPPTPATTERIKKRMQDKKPSSEVSQEWETGENMMATEEISYQMKMERLSGKDISVLYEGAFDQLIGVENINSERECKEIELNLTPKKRLQRKKHRPKVFKEGRHSGTSKPVSPVSDIDEKIRGKDTTKRKYVRRHKDVTYCSDTAGDIVDAERKGKTKSSRRCLNFNLEEPQSFEDFSIAVRVHGLDERDEGVARSMRLKEAVHSNRAQDHVTVKPSLTGSASDPNFLTYHSHIKYLQQISVPNLNENKRNELMVVPYDLTFDLKKKRRPRAKVDFDPESKRVWKLLMGKNCDRGDEQLHVDNDKWWDEERRVFQGRVNLFNARMHLIQGDRHFSQWKGSVVDSVVGVFLTQNVSDHLSSSAFMSLAGNFPGQSKTKLQRNVFFQNPSKGSAESSMTCYYRRKGKGTNADTKAEGIARVSDDVLMSQDCVSSSQNSTIGSDPFNIERNTYDWDKLRKEVTCGKPVQERSSIVMDSLDWEAVRNADVSQIAQTIRDRGMNNVLAERIKEFLNRLVKDHGSIDLEWLRDVPPDKAKDYLLSIKGLGLKSAECVRLLTLQQLAFPVDTNVARICVRLGWVPLEPLPESLQLHVLEMYPVLATIQKYLWPRLCKMDQQTLYELHYQMITFGKVFCTKIKPNCNSCPMRGDCRHFASAFTSARLALPAPEEKSVVSLNTPIAFGKSHSLFTHPWSFPQIEGCSHSQDCTLLNNCVPIIEEPASPEPEHQETLESAIEDAFYEDPDEIPSIQLNFREFTQNLQNYMEENLVLQDGSLSKALVALTPEAASIPMPLLKNESRLRTEHRAYEIPDRHPLLEGLDPREPDDPSPYLLTLWTPVKDGFNLQDVDQPSESKCFACKNRQVGESQKVLGTPCESTCFACNSIQEAESQQVRGTLLIPCRTAMRGSFPLNGTYFQVNEVFADHHSSHDPIYVPRDWIWNLPRRTVFFGTSIPSIFRGQTTDTIQQCFWKGFVCVRGFDRITRMPKPLYTGLHFPASKAGKKNIPVEHKSQTPI